VSWWRRQIADSFRTSGIRKWHAKLKNKSKTKTQCRMLAMRAAKGSVEENRSRTPPPPRSLLHTAVPYKVIEARTAN
jgi:hypothetical protein